MIRNKRSYALAVVNRPMETSLIISLFLSGKNIFSFDFSIISKLLIGLYSVLIGVVTFLNSF